MHRPPRIMPNYGRRQWQQRRVLPKTSISRVLLYDNVMQQQMLEVKVTSLMAARRKTGRILDMHRNSFLQTRLQKQRHVADTVLHVNDVMPVHVAPPTVSAAIVTITQTGTSRPEPTDSTKGIADGDTSREDTTHRDHTAEASPENGTETPAGRDNSTETTSVRDNGTETTAGPDNDGTDKAGDEEDKNAVSSLPPATQTGPQERYGASTSFGFSHQGPQASEQRATHTATAFRQQQARAGEELLHAHTLPDIHLTSGLSAHAGKLVVRMDSDRQGVTRLFHSVHLPPSDTKLGPAKGWGDKLGPGKGWSEHQGGSVGRTVEDTRYRRLEKLLVRLEPPNEGYLELSPSFHSPRLTMTFTRPSSLHSSIATPPSALTRPNSMARPTSIARPSAISRPNAIARHSSIRSPVFKARRSAGSARSNVSAGSTARVVLSTL